MRQVNSFRNDNQLGLINFAYVVTISIREFMNKVILFENEKCIKTSYLKLLHGLLQILCGCFPGRPIRCLLNKGNYPKFFRGIISNFVYHMTNY